MRLCGTAVGRDPLEAGVAEEPRLAPVLGEAPVEVDRHAERRDPVGHGERGLARESLVLGAQVDERNDVDGADAGMRALVLAQVDQADRRLHRGRERLDQLLRGADEREHRTVVVGVGVHVEEPRGCRERLAQRLDLRRVASLRDVRDRFEHHTRESRRTESTARMAMTMSLPTHQMQIASITAIWR